MHYSQIGKLYAKARSETALAYDGWMEGRLQIEKVWTIFQFFAMHLSPFLVWTRLQVGKETLFHTQLDASYNTRYLRSNDLRHHWLSIQTTSRPIVSTAPMCFCSKLRLVWTSYHTLNIWWIVSSENTNWRGSITVRLTSCLFCLELTALPKLNEQQFYLFGEIQTSQTGGQP